MTASGFETSAKTQVIQTFLATQAGTVVSYLKKLQQQDKQLSSKLFDKSVANSEEVKDALTDIIYHIKNHQILKRFEIAFEGLESILTLENIKHIRNSLSNRFFSSIRNTDVYKTFLQQFDVKNVAAIDERIGRLFVCCIFAEWRESTKADFKKIQTKSDAIKGILASDLSAEKFIEPFEKMLSLEVKTLMLAETTDKIDEKLIALNRDARFEGLRTRITILMNIYLENLLIGNAVSAEQKNKCVDGILVFCRAQMILKSPKSDTPQEDLYQLGKCALEHAKGMPEDETDTFKSKKEWKFIGKWLASANFAIRRQIEIGFFVSSAAIKTEESESKNPARSRRLERSNSSSH